MVEPGSSRYKGRAEAVYEAIATIAAGNNDSIKCDEARSAIVSRLETAFLQVESELRGDKKYKHRQGMA